MTQLALFLEPGAAPRRAGSAGAAPVPAAPRPRPLSDTCLLLLVSAAQRADGAAWPPPVQARGDTRKAARQLITRGLLRELELTGRGEPWREARGRRLGLRITRKGLRAINMD